MIIPERAFLFFNVKLMSCNKVSSHCLHSFETCFNYSIGLNMCYPEYKPIKLKKCTLTLNLCKVEIKILFHINTVLTPRKFTRVSRRKCSGVILHCKL